MSKKQNNNFTIDIKNIDNNNTRKIYESLWGDKKFFEEKDTKVQKVFWKTKYSNNSYAFQIKDSKEKIIDNKNISENDIFKHINEKLIKLFGITNKKRFEEKLREACSGSGAEQRRITTLHSSSLCAFLFFYNVSKENPLTLKIGSKEITFIDVLFEFQNIVIEGRNPSNVDVVLLGKADDEKKVILFLESKFSEYLSNGNTNISESYLDKDLCPIGYEIYNNEQLGIEFKKGEKDTEYTLQPKDKEKYYIHGIKQMISHYIGINNLLNGNLCESNTEKLKELYAFLSGNDKKNYNEEELKEMLNDDNTKIYLGEILFDFHNMNITDKETFKDNYSDKYKNLAELLNCKSADEKLNKILNTKIKVLESPLTYSLFKDNKIVHKIEDKIKQYYKLN